MTERKCLSELELSEFVQGRIDDARVEKIAEHLEACGDCQATIVMLGEQSDTLVQQLRTPANSDALEAEDACQAAVERLAASADRQSGTSTMAPNVGEIERLGPYHIQGQLGVGGMGTVYEAVHSKLKRTVALKILPASRWTNPLAVARFEREMEIIGQLDHPNIVRASDAGEEHGMHYLVMEHVNGLDLSRIVNRTGPLGTGDACEIARQVAIGLQYAYENHLVHRDIKPSNLMLSTGCRVSSGDQPVSTRDTRQPTTVVKILDLGLALLSENPSAHENELTTVGQLMGTLDYMSPEQGMDSHEVDIRADIYSLGATLYKLLTGRAPFASPQYNTLLKKVTALANKPVTPIQQLRPDIPDELAAIVDRMLAKAPGDRFSTPDEVSAALEPFASAADLTGLLTAALQVKEREPVPLPPVIAPGKVAASPAPTLKARPAMQGTRRWKLIGLLIALGLFGFAAGIIIIIKTDVGELIVRAEDDARIVVRKDGVTVQQFEVAKGDHAVTVRSGNYRIELQGKSDELMISRDTVTVKRGERVVVYIQQRPKSTSRAGMMMDQGEGMSNESGASAMGLESGGSPARAGSGGETAGFAEMFKPDDETLADAYAAGSAMAGGFGGPGGAATSSDPTYDGKTYTQWLSELQTERKPERLTEAVRAFASLGEDDKDLATRSTAVIMEIMRRNGSYVVDDSPQGKLIQQSQTVLLQMPSDIVISATVDELRDGNTRSRSFVIFFLGSVFYGYGSPNPELATAAERRRGEVYRFLLALPDDESADVRANAMSLVINHAKSQRIELNEVEGLIPRLQKTLTDKDLRLVAVGTEALVEVDPDHKDLVPALVRLLASDNHSTQMNAIRSLGRLGARSQAAVGHLVDLIRPIAEIKSKSSAPAGGYGNYGGGMGAGEGYGFGGPGSMYGGGYDPRQDIYYVTIVALGNIGPQAVEALPLLRKIVATEVATERSEDAGGPGLGSGYGESGEGEYAMSGERTAYIGAAKTAIARIEGKEPIPTTPTKEDKAPAATRRGGFF